MSIKPGDEVICIDDSTLPEQYLGIRAGETYTATWVGMCRTYLGGDYAGIRLAGVNRGVCPQFGEEDPPFALRRFRPVVKPLVESRKKIEESTAEDNRPRYTTARLRYEVGEAKAYARREAFKEAAKIADQYIGMGWTGSELPEAIRKAALKETA